MMHNYLKNLLRTLFLLLCLTACTSDLDIQESLGSKDVTFTATTSLRATGTSWAAGDRIGVYMKPTGTALEGNQVSGSTANVSYTTATASGYFTGTTYNLAYPSDGSLVDFVAYYPYTSSVSEGVYAVNIANQESPELIDLLYANNLTGMNKDSGVGALKFSHQLAQLRLTLVSAEGYSLDGMTATISHVPTTAEFRLEDATFSRISGESNVAMNVSASGKELVASAFLIPDTTPLNVILTNAKGKAVNVQLSSSLTLEKGKTYTFKLNVKDPENKPSEEVPSYVRWTETPTITTEQLADEKLKYVTHYFKDGSRDVRNYSMLYDKNLKFSYWVAYPLCNYYTKKNVSRSNAWAYDPQLPESQQPLLEKGYAGYYDRGHQIPSADRLVTLLANQQTFYYTNMTPQVGRLNQTVWANLEEKIRNWSSNVDTLYVVTGAMPSTPGSTSMKYTRDNLGVQVAVPAYYFKALARIDRQTGIAYTIAFKFDNVAWNGDENGYMQNAISVKELENLTGFKFFPTIADEYKQSFDSNKWQ